MQEPVFMFCVGATKAGTSWLHDQLRNHPDCGLRTIKEYHYFNMKEPHHWENRLGELQAEIDQLAAHDPAERLSDLRAWRDVIAARKIDPALYRDFHIRGGQGRAVLGDVTPAYSLMPGRDLARLSEVGSDLRILYLIRDPLSRLWSHIRMNAARAVGVSDFGAASQTLLQGVLDGQTEGGIQGILRRGDYLHIIPKLRRVFAGAKVMVMFTEEMMTQAGFARILDFLGLRAMTADLDKPVHQGRALALPDHLRAATLQFLRPQYDYIASEFSALPQAWRRNLDEALA